jgi:hypothetical protein
MVAHPTTVVPLNLKKGKHQLEMDITMILFLSQRFRCQKKYIILFFPRNIDMFMQKNPK